MIQIFVNRYLTVIENMPLELVDRVKFDLKIELSESSYKNIEQYRAIPLTIINQNNLLFSTSFYNPDARRLIILTGYIYDLIQALKKFNLKYKLEKQFDKITAPKYQSYLDTRPEQKELVTLALKFKRCLFEAPTAFGKTRAIAEYLLQFKEVENPKLVLVPTVDLMYQTQESLAEYLKQEIGIVGNGKHKLENINVCLIDTLFSKLKKTDPAILDLLAQTKIVIADEVHTYANFRGTLVLKALKNCKYYLGVSATLCIKNLPLLIGLFGPVIKRFPIREAIANDTILNPIIKFKAVPKIDIPLKWETQEYSNYLYNQAYKLCIVNNQVRNKLIAETIQDLIKQSLLPVLILVKRVGTTGKESHARNIQIELEKLDIYLPIVHGKTKNRDQIIQDLKDAQILGVIGTDKILGTGIDINSLNSVVLTAAGSSNKELIQNIGRSLRHGEDDQRPVVIDFFDSTFLFHGQANKRLALAKELYPDVSCEEISYV